MSTAQKHTRNALLAFLTGLIAAYGWMIAANITATIYYVGQTGDRTSAAEALAQNEWLQGFFYIGMQLILGLVVYRFIKRVEKEPLSFTAATSWFPKNTPARPHFTKGLTLALGMQLLAWVMMLFAGQVTFEGFGFTAYTIFQVLGYGLLMVIYNAFPAFFEELFFRGYIQNRLTRQRGPVLAISLTAVLFTVMHLGRYTDISALLYLLLMGILLGLLYHRTGALYLVIGFHFAWDFTSRYLTATDHPGLLLWTIREGGETNLTWAFIVTLILAIATFSKKGKGQPHDHSQLGQSHRHP